MAGNRELSAAVPKTMGFRPDDIKSSGMAARTTWQAVATAAAGEVTDRSGLGVSSAGSFFGPATYRGRGVQVWSS